MCEYFLLKVFAKNVGQKRMQTGVRFHFHQNKAYAEHFIRLNA